MAASLIFHTNILSLPFQSPRCHSNSCRAKTLAALSPCQFLASKSLSKLKKKSLPLNIQFNNLRTRKTRSVPVVYAAQSNFFKVLQTVLNVGKDGIEAGTNLVPDAVPRPVARISVTVVVGALALFVIKSFLSTAFFVLAMMGLIYFTFLALNKDEGPKGGGGSKDEGPMGTGGTSPEDTLEEARRIMEKYK
ncbi:hypothetical protein RJ640_026647 [Escallonia rubra]|uniref:Transmembrane protein n=1 Tax=Escallonia rubra TaxID=112253 RepID=A0AA88ULU2_9ASTE|nr:hypothetical protein RJ640_026647 [Escallonia rubra]